MTTAQNGSEGSLTRKSSYIGDSIAELKKVTFPTRQETVQATLVTLLIVVIVSLCLFILDVVFAQVMSAIFS
jgi:preprotein translocase SecE subunit